MTVYLVDHAHGFLQLSDPLGTTIAFVPNREAATTFTRGTAVRLAQVHGGAAMGYDTDSQALVILREDAPLSLSLQESFGLPKISLD